MHGPGSRGETRKQTIRTPTAVGHLYWSLTCLYVSSGLRSQDGQVHVRFPAVDYWVRVLAGPLRRRPIAHYHLLEQSMLYGVEIWGWWFGPNWGWGMKV